MDFEAMQRQQKSMANKERRRAKTTLKLSNSLTAWKKSIVKLTLYDRGSRSGKILWSGCGVVVELSGRDAVLGGDDVEDSSEEEEISDSDNDNESPFASPKGIGRSQGSSAHSPKSASRSPKSASRSPKPASRSPMAASRSPIPTSRSTRKEKKENARRKRMREKKNRIKRRANEASFVVISTRYMHPNRFSSGHCHVQFYNGETLEPLDLTAPTFASLAPNLFHYTPPLYDIEIEVS